MLPKLRKRSPRQVKPHYYKLTKQKQEKDIIYGFGEK